MDSPTKKSSSKPSSLLPTIEQKNTTSNSEAPPSSTSLSLEEQISAAQQELLSTAQKLDLQPLQAKQIVDEYISQLHTYNETKDAALLVIGKLAAIKSKTVKQLLDEYNISPED
ncbi:hypothetical protein BB560_000504 [Smittium megazygosporum]|uniref:DNA repair protein SWI5 homolog n=1 Tax=Smittium megazygosporum TaxID=133381 RepID=A0A2T9ZK99_9FUNG|nr:hypothetical protein BB560_000504 [Smittium megazygosporum]